MKDHSTLIHLSLEGGVLASVRVAETGAPYHRKAYEVEVVEIESGKALVSEVCEHPLFASMRLLQYTGEMPDLLAAERATQ